MHRRTFLTLAPTIALGSTALSIRPAAAQDAATQFTAAQSRSLGDWTVVALSDGYLPFSPDLLLGIGADEVGEMLRAAYQDPASFAGAVNAYLIDTGETLILIDTGTGTAFGPTLGQLAGNIAAAGHDPARVSLILATHLHPDHVGGVLGGEAAPFPNAMFKVSAADHAFFTDPDVRAAAPDNFKPFFDMAVGALGRFGDKVELFEGEAAVASGITAQPLPGHTPGHCGFLLENGSESLLIWGDIVHVPAVQFARPDVGLVFDVDAAQAAATRMATLDRVATDRLMVAGMHMLFPGFGYVEASGGAYRFVPAPWDYG